MSGFDPHSECQYYSYIYSRYTVPVSVRAICTANPNRVGLVISNNQIYSFVLTQNQSGQPDKYPNLMINGGETFIYNWENIGALVTLQWFGGQTTTFNSNITAPGGVVQITEIIYTPR